MTTQLQLINIIIIIIIIIIKTVCVPYKSHLVSVSKIIGVDCENCTGHVSRVCQDANFLVLRVTNRVA